MSFRTALIINPNALRLRRNPELVQELSRVASRHGRVWVTRDLQALDDAARQIRKSAIDQLVLCGGDGTFMAAVSALHRHCDGRPLPRLCFAPAGTVATVARNFGIRGEPSRILSQVLRGHTTLGRRPCLRVQESTGTVRLGFTFGTGLVSRFFDRYYEAGAQGYRTAAQIVLKTLFGSFIENAYARSVLTPLPCELSVNGERVEFQAYSLLVASVLRDLGLHMQVTYRGGGERPVHLVASPLSPRELGPQVWRVLLGRPLSGGGFDDLVDRFEVNFTGPPASYILDGDVFEARSVQISVGPSLELLVPREAE